MLGLFLSAVTVVWIAWMISRKVYAPAVLLLGGMALIAVSALCGLAPVLEGKAATGNAVVDLFEGVRRMFGTRMSGLGLSIMLISGYSRYMEQLNASSALYGAVAAPLKYLSSPLALFAVAFLITQMLSIFVPSGAGMALLTMVTVYPILVRSGMSRLTALSLVITTRVFGWGPASPNANLAANILNMDIGTYFLQYQTPVVLVLIGIMLVTHLVVQFWWDRREGPDLEGKAMLESMSAEQKTAPRIYAILPVLPLCLIMACSPLVTGFFGWNYKIKMDVGTAMFMCTFIALGFEVVRHGSLSAVLPSLKGYFEAMGKVFALVVVLMVAGEVFAQGLIKSGALATLINQAQGAGLGFRSMTVAASVIIFVSAFLMGSGNAAFFSFANMIPEFAALLNMPGQAMMVTLDLMSIGGRTMSPVFGALIAVSGMAGVSNFQLAKRVAIPVIVCLLATPPLVFLILL